MTSALATMLGLLCAATLTAVLVARRRPEHWPVAAYLGAIVALDVLRLGLAQLLPAGEGPYTGLAEVVRGADLGAYLALCAAPAWLGALVFGAGWWLYVGSASAYSALWLVLVLAYPAVRGELLLDVLVAAEAAGGAAGLCVWLYDVWRRGPRLTLTRCCALVLICASLSTAISAWKLPALDGLGLLEGWVSVVSVHCLALAVVLGAQLWQLLTSQPQEG